MPKVDAHALEAVASVLGVAAKDLQSIDPRFNDRAVIAREATRRGFWNPTARSVHAERYAV